MKIEDTFKAAQAEMYPKAKALLDELGSVYVVMPPRTGKTRVALALAYPYKCTLIITTVKAKIGWKAEINRLELDPEGIEVINYESIHKVKRKAYDVIILDEVHKIGAFPKPNKPVKTLFNLKRKKTIALSATPAAEAGAQLYHQVRCMHSPLWSEYSNFYKWHKELGIPGSKWISGRQIKDYTKVKPIVYEMFAGVSVTYIPPKESKKVIEIPHVFKHLPSDIEKSIRCDSYYMKGEIEITADTAVKKLQKLHQLTGCTVLDDSKNSFVVGHSKIDELSYLIKDDIRYVIFYVFVKEKEIIEKEFPSDMITDSLSAFQSGKANIMLAQYKSFSEGVDFSMADEIIVYSMTWSLTNYLQARDRMNRWDRKKPMNVRFLLTEDGVDHDIYKAVVEKNVSFNSKFYQN
jgi:superfamily II DNA or RNA helicase